MKTCVIRNKHQDLSPAPSIARHVGAVIGVRDWMVRHCQILYTGVLCLTAVCLFLFGVAWRVAPPPGISTVVVEGTR